MATIRNNISSPCGCPFVLEEGEAIPRCGSTLKGLKPLQKRQAEDRTNYFQNYESTKRSRGFTSKWTENRPWLKNSDDNILSYYFQKMWAPKKFKF